MHRASKAWTFTYLFFYYLLFAALVFLAYELHVRNTLHNHPYLFLPILASIALPIYTYYRVCLTRLTALTLAFLLAALLLFISLRWQFLLPHILIIVASTAALLLLLTSPHTPSTASTQHLRTQGSDCISE